MGCYFQRMHKQRHTSTSTQPLAFKVKEAAFVLNISKASVRRLIKRGELTAIRKLRHVLVTRDSVEAFLGYRAGINVEKDITGSSTAPL